MGRRRVITLALETSCDETSCAILRGSSQILSNVIASQADLHARFGGVVPEAASRRHVERMVPVIRLALTNAGIGLPQVDLIGVTNRPGLAGALLTGVTAAKALAYALKRPIVAVHHLEGHIYSARLAEPEIEPPLLALVVSGGHTQLVLVERPLEYRLLGSTRDDAAGEAFDKGARLLGLPYPGGPALAQLAESGEAAAAPMPRAWMGESLDFSFSGIKTALRNALADGPLKRPEDYAAGYQAAIVDVLCVKTMRAAEITGVPTVCVVGGVAANGRLRAAIGTAAKARGLRLVVPPPELCTDNAAMIAAAAHARYLLRGGDAMEFDTIPTESLESAASVPA
ncbi:MAG: tRNA (adenosine(37)-N6)-threonylcarbamoyltransferase complex transferase subunit TsaD [Armatimonadetes bacterium]|nr:tRNA (adenosine(37)-N6)-threonylcarbamoyltransferase complex transferase subunit TsaD [Armatimonadota bacterium]MDE2207321.1 tRNA (adenosine(37)-N6)-threonylcarbamoyltransferase complex transferase subunit TsaD [Armatimonadota bacterium]